MSPIVSSSCTPAMSSRWGPPNNCSPLPAIPTASSSSRLCLIPEPALNGPATSDAGEAPKVVDPSPGCRFEPRCPYAIEECRTVSRRTSARLLPCSSLPAMWRCRRPGREARSRLQHHGSRPADRRSSGSAPFSWPERHVCRAGVPQRSTSGRGTHLAGRLVSDDEISRTRRSPVPRSAAPRPLRRAQPSRLHRSRKAPSTSLRAPSIRGR